MSAGLTAVGAGAGRVARQLEREADELESTVGRLRSARRGRLAKLVSDVARAVECEQWHEARHLRVRIPLLAVDPRKMSVITLRELFRAGVRARKGAASTRTQVARSIGERCWLERCYDRLRQRARDLVTVLRDTGRNENPHNAEARARRMARCADEVWTDRERIVLGSVLISLVLRTTSVFESRQSGRGSAQMVLTPEWSTVSIRELARHGLVLAHDLPMLSPPVPWTSLRGGGYLTNAATDRRPFVEHHGNTTHVELLKRADLSSVFQAVNALQETPWRINSDVLKYVRAAWRRRAERPGLPAEMPEPLPSRPKGESEKELRRWKTIFARAYSRNEALFLKKRFVDIVIDLAERLEDEGPFYFPHFLDSRGRVYPIPPDLHPQSDELGRALMEFSRGKHLGEQGARWLAVHLANTYGRDKDSFEARLRWVSENDQNVTALGALPDQLDGMLLEFWQGADKPWMFLAACIEWNRYRETGSALESHLPVAVDGTANVLQHVSAMTHDRDGAKLTNLMGSDCPSDVYLEIASLVRSRVTRAATRGHELAKHWKDRIDRALVKNVVMQRVYGGEAEAIEWYLITGGHVEHLPAAWEDDASRPSKGKGAEYLVQEVLDGLDEVVPAAHELRVWLQDVADAFSAANNGIGWTTPSGFPVWQESRKKMRRKLRPRGGLIHGVVLKAGKIDKRKQAQAIMANFVHSHDAAHLAATISELHREGLRDFVAIHDGFAVHACDVERLSRALREQFVRMYSEPVLNRFAEHVAREVVMQSALPAQGTFDIKEVLKSAYFFC